MRTPIYPSAVCVEGIQAAIVDCQACGAKDVPGVNVDLSLRYLPQQDWRDDLRFIQLGRCCLFKALRIRYTGTTPGQLEEIPREEREREREQDPN